MMRKLFVRSIIIISKKSISTFETVPVSSSEIISRITKIQRDFPFLVAEAGNKIIGYAYATAWKARTAYKFTAENSVYIHPDETGNGHGKKIYSQLIDILAKAGFKHAIGSIALPNEASVVLHEQLGFRQAGRLERVGMKFGQWIDVGLWQLSL